MAGRSAADLLRLTAAVLSVGAGAIHLLQAPAHDRQAAVYGRFFLVVGTVQLAGGLLLGLRRWPRPAYALAAYGHLTVAGVWAATRTVGIPIGPDAGTRPPVARADLAATLLEVAIALALLAVALPAGWTGGLDRTAVRGRRLAAWLAALSLATAGIVAWTVTPQRPLCDLHASTATLGPLAAVEGHSLLPRTTPPVTVQAGQPARVLAGYLINCASRPVTLERVQVLNTTGTAARLTSFSIRPTTGGVAAVVAGDRNQPPGGQDRQPAEGAVVAPSWRRPALALYADLEPVQPGRFLLSAVRITVRDPDRSRTQPFATILQVRVTRPTH